MIFRRGTQFERFQTTVESFEKERYNISLEHYARHFGELSTGLEDSRKL